MFLDKKIAIWGAGDMGHRVLRNLQLRNYDVVCIYDSDSKKWGSKCFDVPVRAYNPKDKYFIVISVANWQDIIPLIDGNYLEDYCLWSLLTDSLCSYQDIFEIHRITGKEIIKYKELQRYRKIALIYGNCQTRIYSRLFPLSKDFDERYLIISLAGVTSFDNDAKQVRSMPSKLREYFFADQNLFNSVELFIYQVVGSSYGLELSTDWLLARLRDECIKVSIVNLYFDGYFPGHSRDNKQIFGKFYSLIQYGDKYIAKLYFEGKSAEEIYKLISDESFISQKEVIDKCEASIEELRRRERIV